MGPRRCSRGIALLACVTLGLGGWFLLPARADESLAQRRARVEGMSLAEKKKLAQRQEDFGHLEPAERQRLRELDRQLAQDENSEQLRQIMHRYYRWVITLDFPERSELLRLPPAERVKRVKELMDEQARKAARRPRPGVLPPAERARRWFAELGPLAPGAARRPGEEDLKSLQAWLGDYLLQQEPVIVQRLVEPQRRQVRELLDSTQESDRRQSILANAWLQLQLQRPPFLPLPGEKQRNALVGQLSPELRSRLARLSPVEQRRVILLWIRLIAIYRVLQHPETSLPLVNEGELARFFEERLDPSERDRLLTLPDEEMNRELLLLYLRWRLPDERPRPSHAPSKRPPGSRPSSTD